MSLPVKERPWDTDNWYLSPLNWAKEIRATFPNLPQRVHFRDTTLREGEEMTGVAFSLKDKVKIARKLAAIGVEELDVGYPPVHPLQMEVLKTLKKENVEIGYYPIIPIMTPSWKEDIDKSAKAGGERAVIKLSGIRDGPHGNAFTPEGKERIVEGIEYCKDQYSGNKVVVGPTNQTRNEKPFEWLKWCEMCVTAGCDEIDYIDSMGVAHPLNVKFVVEEMKKVIGDIPVGLHMHNDFGMGVANSIFGVLGGAEWIQTTVAGFGDRAGNASFEECVINLEMMYGVDTGIDMSQLYPLAKYVQQVGGVKVASNQPVIGEMVWTEESHASGILAARKADNWRRSENYRPSVVGQKHAIAWGKLAVRPEAIKMALDEMDLSYSEEDIIKIRDETVKECEDRTTRGEARYLTEEEFEEFVKKILRE
ncbi:MAG: LeuA family protein [Candidatus Hodarchaeota archaeon]